MGPSSPRSTQATGGAGPHCRLMGREARLVIVLTHDPHRLPRLGYSGGVNLRDVVIALSWLGRGDYVAADWEEAPKTGTTPPRLTLFSGEAKKRIVAATSSTLGQASKLALGMSRRLVGVSMIEGATAFTKIPSPASSSPSAAESAATPALAAVEALIFAPVRGSRAWRAATLTIRPPAFPRRIAATASRQQRKQLTRLSSISRRSSSPLVSVSGAKAKPPAIWIEAQSAGIPP